MIIPVLLIIGSILCVAGIFADFIPLGIVFIIALAMFLYSLISFTSKNTVLTELGILIMIISIMALAYSVCILFFGIDVKAILAL